MWRFIIRFTIIWCVLIILFFAKFKFGGEKETDNRKFDATNIAEYQPFFIRNNPDTTFAEIKKAVEKFLKTEHLKGGASVCISYNGRLVYAQGIGNANSHSEIQPFNTFRIASASKLVTAIGVMKMVEDNEIDLNQTVFGENGILNVERYSYYKDRRIETVCVRQLLNHSGGWTSRWGDPMFMPHVIANEQNISLPIDIADIIRFMLGKKLHFQPGTGSAYSNFGFGILGEIITEKSGIPYERYIKSNILYPLGIFDMHIGFSHPEKRLAYEVSYYEEDTSFIVEDYAVNGKFVRRPYGGSDIHTLGSAGGWVASSIDLIKIMMAIDGFKNVPDILKEQTLDTMIATDDNRFDPIGWRGIDREFWFRTGTLAATSAIMERRPDNICYVVLLNASNSKGPTLATKLRKIMDDAILKVKDWPQYDLLESDTSWTDFKKRMSE